MTFRPPIILVSNALRTMLQIHLQAFRLVPRAESAGVGVDCVSKCSSLVASLAIVASFVADQQALIGRVMFFAINF